MNLEQVRHFCQILGIKVFASRRHGWVEVPCPLAFHRHPKGKDKNPSFGIQLTKPGRISKCHCLGGDTRVVTWDGIFKIEDLAGKKHKVLTSTGEWVWASFKEYGVQTLDRINVQLNGIKNTIYATPEHRWFVHGRKGTTTTSQLIPNQFFNSVLPSPKNLKPSDEGIRHGLVFGDGSVSKAGRLANVVLHGKKGKLSKYFTKYTVASKKGCCSLSGCKRVYIGKDGGGWKELPSLDSSPDYLAGFIAGWLASDGCITKTGVVLHNKNKEVFDWLRIACLRIGLAIYPTKKWTRYGYGKELSDIFGVSFVLSTLPQSMILRGIKPKTVYDRLRWTVLSVDRAVKKEKVYCAEVPGTHSFALEHNLITGNCFSCGYSGQPGDLVEELRHLLGKTCGIDFKTAYELAHEDDAGGVLETAYAEEELQHKSNRLWGFSEEWLSTFPLCTGMEDGMDYCAERKIPEWVVEKLALRYDPIEKRVAFPVRDFDGALVGLHGRSIEQKPDLRYRMYTYKGHNNPVVWYGENWVDLDRPVLVVESVFDLSRVFQVYQNTICPLTADFSYEKAQRLRDASRIINMFDGDKAGRVGASKLRKLLPKVPFSDILLEDDLDPALLSLKTIRSLVNPHIQNKLLS